MIKSFETMAARKVIKNESLLDIVVSVVFADPLLVSNQIVALF